MTTTTRPPSYQPRVIEHTSGEKPRQISLPEQWLRGLLAGAEALVLTWLVVAVPVIAVYVATAASPALGSAGWAEAARIGTGIWFLAHGAPLTFPDLTISVTPLGLSIMFVFLVSASIRRAQLLTWIPVGVAILTYVGLAAALVFLAPAASAAWGLIGAGAVAALGAAWGMRGRYPALPDRLRDALAAAPAWLTLGWRTSGRAMLIAAAVSAATVLLAIALGFGGILEIHRALHADPLSAVVIVLAQLLVLPALMMWAMSFLAGPGFAVGEGTVFASSGIESGPLPLIPVLGALPRPDGLAAEIPALAVTLVIAGVVTGCWLARVARDVKLWQALAGLGTGVVLATMMITVPMALSAGSVGPGSMSVVGPDPLRAGLSVGWQLAVGAVVAVLVLHPGALRAGWSKIRARST